MKNFMKGFPILLFSLGFIFCHANDGAFRVNGNLLIPMYETEISVKKEILTIRLHLKLRRRVKENSALRATLLGSRDNNL